MFDYFRGYVPTKNKKCIAKFKDVSNLLTLDEAETYTEYAGVIADNVMFVDIDDFEQSEILYQIVQELGIKCRVYGTTRGKHFFFKNRMVQKNGNKLSLAVGLKADIKIGAKNSYSVLRFDGKDREIIMDCEEPQELPKWLLPIKTAINFTDMEEGSRNDTFWKYILTLQSADFRKNEIRECIRLINNYVLKEPLPEKELETILRNEAFSKDVFMQGNTFLHEKFALILKNKCDIIKLNGQLHIFQDGIYKAGKEKVEFEMLKIYPAITTVRRNEVYNYLKIFIQEEAEVMDANLIAFRNGIYDIQRDTLMPFSPDYIITNRIDWDYNPNAYSAVVDEVLNNISMQNEEVRALLEEIPGYCLYRRNELGKAFILTGEKSNGKSTYLNMLKNLLGKNNTIALDLAELNEKFSVVEHLNMLANIGDDIGDDYIPNTGNFKKLVTGDRLKAEYKGGDIVFFESYAKQIYSANSIPRMGRGKDSAAIKRRLVIVPFDARFDHTMPNFKPWIKDELRKQESMEYLIILAIDGLRRVLERNAFTTPEKVQQSIEEYEETNNPIIGFFKEIEREEVKVENEPTNEVFKLYQEYCHRSNLQPLSQIEFSRQVKRHFRFTIVDKKIQGKKYRIFVKED